MSAADANALHQMRGMAAFSRQRVSSMELWPARGEWEAVISFYNSLDAERNQPQPPEPMKPTTSLTTNSTLDPNEYHLPDPRDAEEMCQDCEFFRTAAEAGRQAAADYLTEEREMRVNRVLDAVTCSIVVAFVIGAAWLIFGGIFS